MQIISNLIVTFLGKIWYVIFNNLDSKNIIANFIGGLSVVAFLFIWNEFLGSKGNLTGEWEVENTVSSTEYKPFDNLKVIWRMHILQSENIISGSGEKIKDVTKTDDENSSVHEYTPTTRDTVELQGYIKKNYLRKSQVFINVIQVGQLRKSRATYMLELINKSTMVGTFVTTAGNSKGVSTFSKNG